MSRDSLLDWITNSQHTTTMVKAKCNICHDAFPIQKFLFLLCGHGFCKDCSSQIRKSTTCPVCREPKGKYSTPHPIYIDFLPPPDSQSTNKPQAPTPPFITHKSSFEAHRKRLSRSNSKNDDDEDAKMASPSSLSSPTKNPQKLAHLVENHHLRLSTLQSSLDSANQINGDVLAALEIAAQTVTTVRSRALQAENKLAREVAKNEELALALERQEGVVNKNKAEVVKLKRELEDTKNKFDRLNRKMKLLINWVATNLVDEVNNNNTSRPKKYE